MVLEALQSENANEEIQTDIVILPPEKTDSLTDNEEILEDGEKLGDALPKNDVAGTLEIHCNHDDIDFMGKNFNKLSRVASQIQEANSSIFPVYFQHCC